MLSTVFSLSVSAKSIDVPSFKIVQSALWGKDGSSSDFHTFTFTPRNNTQEADIYQFPLKLTVSSGQNVNFYISSKITALDGGLLIKNTDKTKITFRLWSTFLLVKDNTERYYLANNIDTHRVLVTYNDNTMEYFECDLINDLTFVCEFQPKKSIKELELIEMVDINTLSGTYTVTSYLGERSGDTSFELYIEQEEENTGLLKNIKDGISGLSNGIKDVFNSITELPQKIWGFIENGLKSLFVPDEEFMLQFKSKFDEMLSNKLGAVYQVVNLTLESWDRIQVNDDTNSIDFPSATIDLGNGNTFSFGGYSVQIVPDGFDFLATAIKTIVGILCTIAFINGLRKRYDEVMGVEK